MREARMLSLVGLDPPSRERSVIERPPPGPARGVIPAPGLAVVALTLLLVMLTVGYYVLQKRRARRR